VVETRLPPAAGKLPASLTEHPTTAPQTSHAQPLCISCMRVQLPSLAMDEMKMEMKGAFFGDAALRCARALRLPY